MIVLISDLLASVERLDLDLGYLCAGGHDVVLFQVLDPAELNFGFDSPALFRDIESGRDLYIDPAAAQKGYKQLLQDHLAKTDQACRRLGIDYHLFATDRPFDLALLEFLQHRMLRSKQIRHVNRPQIRRTT